MDNKEKKIDTKTLNELIRSGSILLKITLTMMILSIAAVVIYLLDKTNILGYTIAYTKDFIINRNKQYFTDYIILRSKGHYIMQIFYHTNLNAPIVLRDFWVE